MASYSKIMKLLEDAKEQHKLTAYSIGLKEPDVVAQLALKQGLVKGLEEAQRIVNEVNEKENGGGND